MARGHGWLETMHAEVSLQFAPLAIGKSALVGNAEFWKRARPA